MNTALLLDRTVAAAPERTAVHPGTRPRDCGYAACVVVTDPSADVREMDRFCQQRTAAFKRPRHHRFLPTLPKNGTGKERTTELWADGARRAPAPGATTKG